MSDLLTEPTVAPPRAGSTEAALEPTTLTRSRLRWGRAAHALRGARGVALVTVLIQLAMVTWAYRHHLIYGFGDTLSHMTIARRLWDSPNPGLSQLGTTWLPLPHIAFSIGSIWMWAWRTGLGGSLWSSLCAVAAAVSLYRIGERTGVGATGGWVAAMILATNPSWSYLSAVPMTEPFTIALTCVCVATLLGWSSAKRPYSAGITALFCGGSMAADILSRFEAWGFFALALVYFVVVAQRRFGWSATFRRQVLAFAGPPALALVWWFTFNWTIFGSPLAFFNGQYSSQSLISPFVALGLDYGRGSWTAASALYGRDVIDIGGLALVVVALVGLGATLVRWRGWAQEMWLCLLGPGAFVVAAIYLGQIYIRLPEMLPYGVENARYGVELLPFLAVASAQVLRLVPRASGALVASDTGALVARDVGALVSRALAAGVVVVASATWVAGLASGAVPGQTLTVLEARANATAGASQRAAARWLHTHARNGYVVLDETVAPIVPLIGLDLHRVIIRSSGRTFRYLLAHPRHITWLLVDPGNRNDIVWNTLKSRGVFGTLFYPVADFKSFVVYEQIAPSERPPATSLIPAT